MIKLFFIPETLRKGGLILFQVDMKSRKSIYEQVVDNVKELIVTGLLPAESKLPSVRELSEDAHRQSEYDSKGVSGIRASGVYLYGERTRQFRKGAGRDEV